MRTLAVIAVMVGVFAAGRASVTAPPRPLWNDEQLVRATSHLDDWLQRNDPLDYDYPNPLGCTPRKAGGLRCRFGVTYQDETTRYCAVVLDEHNIPWPTLNEHPCGPRSEPSTTPPY